MNQLFMTLLSGLFLFIFSCRTPESAEPAKQPQTESRSAENSATSIQRDFTVNPENILRDFSTWYHYTHYTIRLAQDFIGLNTDSAAIHKANFLTLLQTGNFVPFKTGEQDGKSVYKLYRLRQRNNDIVSTIKLLAATEMEHFKMEGNELPYYSFADLSGKRYSKVNTKGNTLLIKCWFINCVACVKEFPELNRLVDKYHHKNDLQFLSLATDARDDLVSFLHKRVFKYVVVANAGEYMSEKLKISAYPTHILVDKKGKIVKVTNSVDDMIPFLEKEIAETAL